MEMSERLRRIANWLEQRDCISEARDLARLSEQVADVEQHRWAVAFGPGLSFSVYRIPGPSDDC